MKINKSTLQDVVGSLPDKFEGRAIKASNEMVNDLGNFSNCVLAERREYGPYDGQYCCSPVCDRYMAHMGVKPKLVECQFKANKSKYNIRGRGGVVNVKVKEA